MAAFASRVTAALQNQMKKDNFVSGLERIEIIEGTCVRFVFFNMKTVNGKLARVIDETPLVMPIQALADKIGKELAALGRQVIARPDGSLTVMH